MGLHLNWLAVEGGDMTALLARLGLEPSGVASDPFQARVACTALPNGWIVVVSSEFALDLNRLLPAASVDGLALGCEISEVAMGSSAQAYGNGRRLWAVEYDGGNGPADPKIEGEAPAELAEIRAQLERRQAEAQDESVDHMFDAPGELARSVCGFGIEHLPPAEWIILCDSRAHGAPETPRETLADRIRSEILPLLSSLGWEPAAGRLASPNLYNVARICGGRLEGMALNWKHEGAEIWFVPTFAVWQGETKHSPVLVLGEVLQERERFWTRLRQRFEPKPRVEDRLAQVVAEAKRDVLALDRFITQGESDGRIRLLRGSAEDLRPPGSEPGPLRPPA